MRRLFRSDGEMPFELFFKQRRKFNVAPEADTRQAVFYPIWQGLPQPDKLRFCRSEGLHVRTGGMPPLRKSDESVFEYSL